MFTFIQDFIEKAPTRTVPKTGRPVCYKQLREYERTFHYLKEFAKNKNEPINFQDITLDFYHDFITYLQSEKTITRKT
ncbi:MAG TPA: phage integrase SAM-like domain-containing protein, partial [Bacteroidales bacterium]|nr:phage integrase SAM-like domain-containing protein [Bacteroidales bacterium]